MLLCGSRRHFRGAMKAEQDRLRPDHKTALMVVDLQQALCDAAPSEPIQTVMTHIEELLQLAKLSGWPVVFVQHWTEPGSILDRGSAGWQLAGALRDRVPDFHLEKNALSCFEDGRLHVWLNEKGITRLCITGMQTEYCISAACEGAAARGYDVILPVDAHMTIDGPDRSAAEIVAEANERLAGLAQCMQTASICAAHA